MKEMIVTFLGTAAAEGYPNAFCQCANCQRARILGGLSLRKRSSALINSDLLIDFGPDIMAASAQHGCSLAQVRYCLQTHPHADHLDPCLLLSRSSIGGPRLQFYASAKTLSRVAQMLQADLGSRYFLDPEIQEKLNLDVHPIEPLQSFPVGPFQVTAFPATHDPRYDCLLYVIKANGRAIFYGTDTSALSEDTWQTFQRSQIRFDVVILDHTKDTKEPDSGHLTRLQFIEQVTRMREEQLLTPLARIFATHMSPITIPPHPDMVELASQYGYEVAYDGLRV
jgi:phosphoribosyl 1,2-cyclic phosphodiesterase